jgi:inosose dehydratase
VSTTGADANRDTVDRIGHTGITWPFTPDGADQAMTDVAAEGYAGVELFGFVLDQYQGGIAAVRDRLQQLGLAYASSYCSVSLVDPALRDQDLESMRRWARQVADLGGDVAVVGPDQRTRDGYDGEDYIRIAATLNDIGRLCADVGVAACFHPHTGTPVDQPESIDRVMDAVDSSVVFMAPDTGQIAKGGGDPVELVRTYRSQIRHMHLKDYVGGVSQVEWEGSDADRTGYLDYLPLGKGVVDISGIVDALGADYSGWWMVELDATEVVPEPPRTAIATSMQHLRPVLARVTRS